MEWGDRYGEPHEPASTRFAALKTWQKVVLIAAVAVLGIAIASTGVLDNP